MSRGNLGYFMGRGDTVVVLLYGDDKDHQQAVGHNDDGVAANHHSFLSPLAHAIQPDLHRCYHTPHANNPPEV